MAVDIVVEVYKRLEDLNQDEEGDEDRFSPEFDPDPVEGGWIDPPVPEGTPMVPVPVAGPRGKIR